MSHKSPRIAQIIDSCQGKDLDAHYLGYFECFNRQLFFEAHEVLEELWLGERGQARDLFYKGLIQLAGAFVHVQKNRPGPAAALFELARANLERYSPLHERLNVVTVLALIGQWLVKVRAPDVNLGALPSGDMPTLRLEGAGTSVSPGLRKLFL